VGLRLRVLYSRLRLQRIKLQ